MTWIPKPPAAAELNRAQYSGWACCWCATSLLGVSGVISAGIAEGRMGAHVLDTEVYACGPRCPQRPRRRPRPAGPSQT
ncbi:hypothetical protein [Streptomyces sp. NBC_00443]|uniref:hypothetical protein n=1 Tax=Streptomyces sp. NBC_00443 TaxID=2975743 RepID=UPI002E21F2A3